jgi:ABC-type glycerol-3-phosphate transport system substrate-binding protein
MFYGEIYNPATDMTEKVTLPDNFSQYKVFNGTKTDVLLCDSSGIYQYNAGDNMPTEIFSYIDADLDINGLQMIYQTDETHFVGSFSEGGYPKIVLFNRNELQEGVQKQNIILGTSDELDAELRSRIISFNRENSQYKISVRQYVSYNKEMSAAVQLNMDIMSGNMPDILVIDSETPLESYISKGLIADIGKLIEQDDELENNQFMENIFDAFCVDGVLYYVVPGFSVDTLVAKQTKVGNRTGWNNKEFTEVIADISEETEILSESSRYSYITDFMSVCGREFVDMDSGKCNFGSEDFKSALEFAATLPETVEKSQYEENSFDSRYIEDRALLQPVTICKISNLTQQINGSIGEEIAYVGYPCENREGSCIKICGNGFVLSGKSDKLDGAWQFVRYYLTEDYQRNEMFDKGMPTRKDIFYEKAQSAAEYEGYCFINEEFVPLPPLTQEQIDAAVSFIEGLHNTAFEDEVIMNIIFEEAESFFNGNRTVEDVAKVIQNRVQLYLNEA